MNTNPEVEETPMDQIERLAHFIIENIPGEPSQSEGAVDTAIRLLSRLTRASGQPAVTPPSSLTTVIKESGAPT